MPDTTYPKRPKFYAHRVCRYLTKPHSPGNRTHSLYARRHHCPPGGGCKAVHGAGHVYNEQLMPVIGVEEVGGPGQRPQPRRQCRVACVRSRSKRLALTGANRVTIRRLG